MNVLSFMTLIYRLALEDRVVGPHKSLKLECLRVDVCGILYQMEKVRRSFGFPCGIKVGSDGS